jgi:hypothetical protein
MVEGQLEVCSSTHYDVRTSSSIYYSIQLRDNTTNKIRIELNTAEEVSPACLGLAPKVPTQSMIRSIYF